MRFIKIQRIAEFHPGAKSIRETLEYFIRVGEERGISSEAFEIAIKMMIDYFSGEEYQRVERGSEIAHAIELIEMAIHTAMDDGYPLEWIQRELRKFT